MLTATSKDGTRIAYEKNGSGPALILVDGALCYRSFGPMEHLSKLLAPHFTVIHYDRRGRGDSTNSKPYAVEREVEDIEALINEAGGSAYVFGTSSGAILSLETALRLGDKIKKLALYEPPYNSDAGARLRFRVYKDDVIKAAEENRPGDAVATFMQYVGTPEAQIDGMRNSPAWPMMEAIGHTLAYDAEVMGLDGSVPVDRVGQLSVPTLVMDGGANFETMPFMRATATTLAETIPAARHRTLEGQTHDVNLEVLAPVLIEFFEE